MRVLFATVLQPSHFYPVVPLAWALRAAGHEVRVATPPDLRIHVDRSGLVPVPVGPEMRIDPSLREKAKRNQASWARGEEGPAAGGRGTSRPTPEQQVRHNRIAISLFKAAAERMAPDLMDLCRQWRPELVVFDWQCYAAHVVAAALGIPSVRHQSPGPDFAHGIPGWRDMEIEALADLHARYGLDRIAPEGAATVDPCPPALQYDLPASDTRLPVRFVPYNGNAVMEGWMARRDPARPRVALTMGGAYFWMTGHLDPVRRFAEALAEEDLEVIAPVPTGGAAALGSLGPGARVVENLPLELFLPSCDAIIDHGGSGTVSTALVHGVPQVVSPPASMGEPPFHNAERLVRAGAGAEVDVYVATPESLRDAVRTVLSDPAHRESAEKLAELSRELPAPADIVPRLEEIAADRRTENRSTIDPGGRA